MKKFNKTMPKRSLAFFLSLMMCVSLLQIPAFATEGDAERGAGENSGVSEVTATVTVTPKGEPTTETVRDEQAGTTTTTTTTESEISGKDETGGEVTGSQIETETTVTDSQDRVVKEAGTDQGETTATNTTTTEVTTTETEPKGKEEVTEGATTTTETEGKFEDVSGPETKPTETQKVEGLPYAGDITVNLKPGEEKTVTKAISDEELAAIFKKADTDFPLNEIGEPGEPTVETKDNGDTITTTRTQENGQFVKTVLTEKADGSKVEEKTTVTLIGSDNGEGGKNVTEFTITTVTTTTQAPQTEEETEKGSVSSSSDTVQAAPVTEDKTTITLPEKPLSTEAISADGTRTVVTVENILDETGQTVGYQTTTTVTSADGKRVSCESASLWGTKTTVQTTTQKDTTTVTDTWTNKVTTTTTTVITQGTTMSGHKITATEREVTASMGNVIAGPDNGVITMSPTLTPNVKEPNVGTTNKNTDLYHRKDGKFEWGNNTGKTDENGYPIYNCTIDLKDGEKIKVQVAKGKNGEAIPVSYDFEWFGEYGLESAIRVKAPDQEGAAEGTWQPHQFVLTNKDGKKFYVYCADFEVSPANGAPYNMTNIEDANYYNEDAAEHIRYIAENGYWGTKSGTGSLKELKKWLKGQGQSKTGLTDQQIDRLTEGQALTATQAAIWHFGNSGDQTVGGRFKDIVGDYYNGSSFDKIGTKDDDRVLTQALYNFLIQGQKKAPDETTLITEKVFATTSAITVGEKVTETDSNGNTVFKATTDGRDYYKTDVSFGMSVVPSKDGDLIVQVVVDNEVVATKRLAGKDDDTQYGMIEGKNGNYTITGLELPNGSTITLNLSGTQALEKGVYLYTCATGHEGSQTFVGMGEGSRSVNLSVDLNFNVKEPEANITKNASSHTQQKTDKVTQTREDQVTQKQVTAEITVTTTTTTENKTAWDNSWEQLYTYPTPDRPSRTPDPDPEDPPVEIPDPDVPLVPGPDPEGPTVDIPDEQPPLVEVPDPDVPLVPATPEVEIPDPDVPLVPAKPEIEVPDPEVPLVDIPDEEVPLADVPNTGDDTALWYTMALAATAGIAWVMLWEKKKAK